MNLFRIYYREVFSQGDLLSSHGGVSTGERVRSRSSPSPSRNLQQKKLRKNTRAMFRRLCEHVASGRCTSGTPGRLGVGTLGLLNRHAQPCARLMRCAPLRPFSKVLVSSKAPLTPSISLLVDSIAPACHTARRNLRSRSLRDRSPRRQGLRRCPFSPGREGLSVV